jgi:hypothetical protein
VSNKVYGLFKAACDHFFDQKRASGQEADKQYIENLKLKEEICIKISAFAEDESASIDQLESMLNEWSAIGYVPRDSIKAIQKKFEVAMEGFLSTADLNKDDKNRIQLQMKFGSMKGDPHAHQKIQKKEYSLRNQIKALENDVSTWVNNLEFFSKSKTADTLRDEFEVKINAANSEIKSLKDQLRMIRSM